MIHSPPAQVQPGTEAPAAATLAAVLALSRADGAIPDTPGGTIVNADSNFLYLLTGMAAQAGRNPALWAHVERGLRWLSLRLWGDGEPLPGAFPDALPLAGPGRPMGAPATAAIGATSARFVALVAALPVPPEDLVQAARIAWNGLLRWNWVEGKGMRNAWQQVENQPWAAREVWYGADQADYSAGRTGALRLGLAPCPRVDWRRFSPGRLAVDGKGQGLPLAEPEEAAALAVLAFDGPRNWRPAILGRLRRLEARTPGLILALAARAHLGDAGARRRLLAHLRSNPMPRDRDRPGSPAYSPVAGFVLRALAP